MDRVVDFDFGGGKKYGDGGGGGKGDGGVKAFLGMLHG